MGQSGRSKRQAQDRQRIESAGFNTTIHSVGCGKNKTFFAEGQIVRNGLGLLDSSDDDSLPKLSASSGCCLIKRQERNRDDYHKGSVDPPGYGDLINAGMWRRARNWDMEGRSYVLIANEARSTVPLLRVMGIKRHCLRHQHERSRCGCQATMQGMA